MVLGAFHSTLVRICSLRITISQLLQEADARRVKWRSYEAAIQEVQDKVIELEQKVSRAARRDFPAYKPPKINIHQ
jgi:NADH:ubiquinone oxidoreductase subunit 3 (subunit A)